MHQARCEEVKRGQKKGSVPLRADRVLCKWHHRYAPRPETRDAASCAVHALVGWGGEENRKQPGCDRVKGGHGKAGNINGTGNAPHMVTFQGVARVKKGNKSQENRMEKQEKEKYTIEKNHEHRQHRNKP